MGNGWTSRVNGSLLFAPQGTSACLLLSRLAISASSQKKKERNPVPQLRPSNRATVLTRTRPSLDYLRLGLLPAPNCLASHCSGLVQAGLVSPMEGGAKLPSVLALLLFPAFSVGEGVS